MQITFISGNAGKAEEVARYLSLPIKHQALALEEIQSLSSEAIVRDKAQKAYALLQSPVLVEDVSFSCPGLGGLPGPLIKWFEEAIGNDGICALLTGRDRSCVASVTYALYDGTTMHIVSGAMEGTVPDAPRGTRSFGWAPIFVPVGMDKTYAELTDEEQQSIAMRHKALTQLAAILS